MFVPLNSNDEPKPASFSRNIPRKSVVNEQTTSPKQGFSTFHSNYQTALEHLAFDRTDRAESIFTSLFSMISKAKESESSTDDLSKLDRLQFGIMKNLAGIYSNTNRHAEACDKFLQAIKLEPDLVDVNIWYALGADSCKSDQYNLARHAFEQALRISPDNWLCLDKLIAVYFILGDYPSCLNSIKDMLERKADHRRSLILRQEIYKKVSYLSKNISSNESDIVLTLEDCKMLDKLKSIADKLSSDCNCSGDMEIYQPKIKLREHCWAGLGEALFGLLNEAENNNVLGSPISLADWLVLNEAELSEIENSSTEQSDLDLNSQKIAQKKRKFKESFSGAAAGSGYDSPEVKRRSSRLIPGFFIEDPEPFGPLTTKPMSLQEQLYSFLPQILKNLKNDDPKEHQTSQSTETNFCDSSKFTLLPKNQTDDVVDFLRSIDQKSISTILDAFILKLNEAKIFELKWDTRMVLIFVKLWQIWSETNQTMEFNFERCKVLLSGLEIYWAKLKKDDKVCDLAENVFCYLQHFINDKSFTLIGKNSSNFECKFYWLAAKIAEHGKNFDLARNYLQLCQSTMSFEESNNEKMILLPNCNEIIDNRSIESKFRLLNRHCSLQDAETAFQSGDFGFIAENLDYLYNFGEFKELHIDENPWEKLRRIFLLIKANERLERSETMLKYSVQYVELKMSLYNKMTTEQVVTDLSEIQDTVQMLVTSIRQHQIKTVQKVSLLAKQASECLINVILFLIELIDRKSIDKNQSALNSIAQCLSDAFLSLYNLCNRIEIDNFDTSAAKRWWSSCRRSTLDSDAAAAAAVSGMILITKSLMILNLAHEELGKRQMCMVQEGRFLQTIVTEIRETLRNSEITQQMPSSINDDTLNCAEQCFYCLYNYPRKKARGMSEHQSKNISLAWPDTFVFFDFVRPEKSPEFDDTPTDCLSSETVHLFHRIEQLVPEHLKPEVYLDQFVAYLNGQLGHEFRIDQKYIPVVTTPNSSPISAEEGLSIVWNLYHLIGDYYRKSKDKDLEKVARYLQLDLCLSQDRADSWAGLALTEAAMAEHLLESPDIQNTAQDVKKVLDKANVALFCYKKVLQFLTNHISLLLEYGCLLYSLHGFVNRALKRKTSKLENVDDLKLKRQTFLCDSERVFEHCAELIKNSEDQSKDAWLIHYMLGKISEKRQADPKVFLPHYYRAAYHLNEEGARYPIRIAFQAPRFAYEALEMFYRFYASTLKWLLQKKKADIPDTTLQPDINFIKRYFDFFKNHPFRKAGRQVENRMNPLTFDPDVVDLLGESVNQIVKNDDQNCNVSSLVQEISSVLHILTRKASYPYYKAYYWLAEMHYSSLLGTKNLKTSRQILIGPQCSNNEPCLLRPLHCAMPLDGLWAIPADDISRAGSFSNHVYKIVHQLIRVLVKLEDLNNLCDLSAFLLKTPTDPSEIYLRDSDRVELAQMCFTYCETLVLKMYSRLVENKHHETKIRIAISSYKYHCELLVKNHFTTFATRWSKLVLQKIYADLAKKEFTTDEAMLKFFSALSKPKYVTPVTVTNSSPQIVNTSSSLQSSQRPTVTGFSPRLVQRPTVGLASLQRHHFNRPNLSTLTATEAADLRMRYMLFQQMASAYGNLRQ